MTNKEYIDDVVQDIYNLDPDNTGRCLVEDVIKLVEEKFTSAITHSTKSLCDNCLCDCVLEDFCDSEGFAVSRCQRHRTM